MLQKIRTRRPSKSRQVAASFQMIARSYPGPRKKWHRQPSTFGGRHFYGPQSVAVSYMSDGLDRDQSTCSRASLEAHADRRAKRARHSRGLSETPNKSAT